ncbi:hypothetical protein HMPREF0208_02822 [Citrobacter koseri]|nr:hypothetical protein HMPREF0208_02822 [Citrobacter koseri]BCL49357.1 hypothetical protein MPUCK001_31750 [Citrobacter koseri]BDG83824.1 hypothetical protein TUM13189_13840 [Citrobacter koseri]BDG88678.1 hypothetical protein TUM20903_14160 [Citrobacter koseri]
MIGKIFQDVLEVHTPIGVNAVAGSKECGVSVSECAFVHISKGYINKYITKGLIGE